MQHAESYRFISLLFTGATVQGMSGKLKRTMQAYRLESTPHPWAALSSPDDSHINPVLCKMI